jgi:hypothetical protein
MDIVQPAGTAAIPAALPCTKAINGSPVNTQIMTLITNAAMVTTPTYTCPARNAIVPLDIDHQIRTGMGAPCVVTQTYWVDAAGKLRLNRIVELSVAVILNILWFILTWVHNPFACCACCDKARKLKKVQEQLDDRMELFLSPEEKAKLKQKTLEAERNNFKKGDMKSAVAADEKRSKTPSKTIPNLSKGFSSEDEYFDPDSDQSSDVSFSSRGRT